MMSRIDASVNTAVNTAINTSAKSSSSQLSRSSPKREDDTSSQNISGEVAREASKLSKDELAAIVKDIASDLELVQTKISVRFDKESDVGIMEVVDRQTGQVIKQMPPEEIVKIKKAFKTLVTGFLINEMA